MIQGWQKHFSFDQPTQKCRHHAFMRLCVCCEAADYPHKS